MTEYIVKVYDDKTEWYNKKGDLHREDGPAIEYTDGTKGWFLNGQLHREDGPAIEYANGDKAWYLNGKNYTYEEWKYEVDCQRWLKGEPKKSAPCNGKIVEIDGKKYKLMAV
jgi:hypothetical protein